MREKRIEDIIKLVIRSQGGWGQKVQSGAIMRGGFRRNKRTGKLEKAVWKINLADAGTPDMLTCFPVTITPEMVGKTVGVFLAIEVKKDAKEIERWLRIKDAYESGEPMKASWVREYGQIIMMRKIIEAGGQHMLVSDIDQFKKDLRDLLGSDP